ncbi:MAG: hypothetical protein RLZZ70_754 [Candidatus Parcubacteria bacterium]|jgi:carbamoyltransferase
MENNNYILGIHGGHDATVVLLKNGVVVEAMSEERLSRQKKHQGFPFLALAYIKNKYKITSFFEVVVVGTDKEPYWFSTIEDNIAHRQNPVKANYYARSLGVFIPWLGKLFAIRDRWFLQSVQKGSAKKVENFIASEFPEATITYIDHHLAHAWATVPFYDDVTKPRLILTLDGAGDGLAGSVCVFKNGTVERISTSPMSASLGLLYCAVVDILGMARNEHEFKVMGLAPYAKASSGEKVYQKLKELVWFNTDTLQFESKIPLDKATPYLIAQSFYQYRFDSLAYGIQKLTEQLVLTMAKAAIKKTGISDVAIGGGVFMNVKANQYLRALPEVTSLTVAPSCGDESLAIGAVVARYSELHNGDLRALVPLKNIYLGSEFNDEQINQAINSYDSKGDWVIQYCNPSGPTTIEQKVAELLSQNSVVGRFKGRSEWGARALGNRSILANPMSRDNVKLINEMIKGRDFWMPFATSMLYERRNDYLIDCEDYLAPFMAITFETKPIAHTELIAALHPYDLTSRPQMVQKETNPEYHALIQAFEKITGVGGILNTSFNLHGEPNVENPTDALRTFALSGLPHLALGNYLISKK